MDSCLIIFRQSFLKVNKVNPVFKRKKCCILRLIIREICELPHDAHGRDEEHSNRSKHEARSEDEGEIEYAGFQNPHDG